MYVTSATAIATSVMKLRRSTEPVKVAEAGVMGAFVFAAQMINFAIPGTGSSGHLCGGMLLAAVLGPYLGFLALTVVLLVQCLLFADGGILALGANIWNMAFYGCMLGGGVIWPLISGRSLSRAKVFAACVIGNIIALQLGAFTVTLQTLASGVTELPFTAFLIAMQPIHLAIGTIEGLITASVLCFILETRPEMLAAESRPLLAKLSRPAMLSVLTAVAFVVGGFLSLLASSSPDGLEWSMERVAGTAELERTGTLHSVASGTQEKVAILPDYALPNSESVGGNILSGLVGTGFVLLLCACGAYTVRKKHVES
jgi:cobalt/nickel transport system permease protein